MSFLGCSIEVEEGDSPPFDRESISEYVSSVGIGYRPLDFVELGASYIYNDKDMSLKYGEDFLIEELGGHEEGTQIMWFQDGTATFYYKIEQDAWKVEFAKPFFGKWRVTSCNYDEEYTLFMRENPH